MPAPKILAFSGSARKESFNKKLLAVAVSEAKAAGADVAVVDFRDLPMPLYDGDLEASEGLPENVKKFKKIMLEHQGLLIAAPEYNSSITPLLKNSLDWASRGNDDLACFKGKIAGLLSASPGGLGGLRGLVTVRAMLGNIGVLVIPNQFSLVKASEAFNPDGSLKDASQLPRIKSVCAHLVTLVKKTHA